MRKVRLGKSGLMVSRIGFGGIPIQRCTESDAVAVVKRCLELGITYVDTANAYTTSEGNIGRAIRGQRDNLILATKSGARTGDGVREHLKLSLSHLGVEYIDLYQLHGVNDFKAYEAVLKPGGPLAVMEEARAVGVVRHIGFTSHAIDVAKEAVKSDRFETIMFPFNFVTSEPGEELLPLAREHDVGFIAMKPLAGGMIENVTVAFKYLLQFPDVVPIVGIEKVREIEEIMQILGRSRRLTKSEQVEMQRLKSELGTEFCRRCDYCQPCTAGIAISTVMNGRSFARRLPPERILSGWIAEALEKAASCTQCGDCEERCPFHLHIREVVAREAKWYQALKQESGGRGVGQAA